QSGEPKGLLLTGPALLRARRRVRARQTKPTETERRYLKASANAWWRRLGTFALMVFIAGFGGFAWWEWDKADRALAQARAAREEAEEQKRNAEDESRRANALARTVRVRAAQFALQRGLALCECGENGVGLTWLANALEQTPEDERSLREVVQ